MKHDFILELAWSKNTKNRNGLISGKWKFEYKPCIPALIVRFRRFSLRFPSSVTPLKSMFCRILSLRQSGTTSTSTEVLSLFIHTPLSS